MMRKNEVSEQNKKTKSDNQNITENNEPLKNDFLNNLSKDFKDIKFDEKNDSKRVLDNKSILIPLPKIAKSKRWLELTDNRLSFLKYDKIQPEKIGASSPTYLITEDMYQSIHNLPKFAKSHACILTPCDIAGLVSNSSIGVGSGNTFLSGVKSSSQNVIYRRMNEKSFNLKEGQLRVKTSDNKINQDVVKKAIIEVKQKIKDSTNIKDLFQSFKRNEQSALSDIFYSDVSTRKDFFISYGPQCYPFLFEIKIPSDASEMYIVDLNKYGATLAILINHGYSFKFISFSIISEKSWEIVKIKLNLEKN